MELLSQQKRLFEETLFPQKIKAPLFSLPHRFQLLLDRVKIIGLVKTMEEYDQRKLGIFNKLNFFQLIVGLLVPLIGVFTGNRLPFYICIVTFLPAIVSLLTLYLNKIYKHEAALLVYFILYPFVTCVVYLYGLNPGLNLFFILYGILSVFFLKDIGYIIFSLGFSMVSYFILSVVLKHYVYDLQIINHKLYLLNQVIASGFIFYGLFLIKNENNLYQYNILLSNQALRKKNEQIENQSLKLAENARLLKKQADEMAAMNISKNKLFSIISHDLKAPLYALRNLFDEVEQQNIKVTELRKMVPEVLKDMNQAVGLMDNLLQWAKAQMKSNTVYPINIEIEKIIKEVLQLLHLQAKAKNISIETAPKTGLIGFADKDMTSLVLRNLVSNAIKFTPAKGTIFIGVKDHDSFVEIYIRDSGAGISAEDREKINNNNYFTTNGTARETGTGLGLMLCKEFLNRNGGRLHIESEPGAGSIFSFTLPCPA